jgi:hypothetical protein
MRDMRLEAMKSRWNCHTYGDAACIVAAARKELDGPRATLGDSDPDMSKKTPEKRLHGSRRSRRV